MGMMEMGAIALVPALIEGAMAAVITAIVAGGCVYVFRWGNSCVRRDRSFLSILTGHTRASARDLAANYRSLCARAVFACFGRSGAPKRKELPVESGRYSAAATTNVSVPACAGPPRVATAEHSCGVFKLIAGHSGELAATTPLPLAQRESECEDGSAAQDEPPFCLPTLEDNCEIGAQAGESRPMDGGSWAVRSPRAKALDEGGIYMANRGLEGDSYMPVLPAEDDIRAESRRASRDFDLLGLAASRVRKISRDLVARQRSRHTSRDHACSRSRPRSTDYEALVTQDADAARACALSPPASPPETGGKQRGKAKAQQEVAASADVPADVSADVPDDVCPVCLEPLGAQGTMEMPLCRHVIHSHCALRMAARCMNGTACPICREQHPDLQDVGCSTGEAGSSAEPETPPAPSTAKDCAACGGEAAKQPRESSADAIETRAEATEADSAAAGSAAAENAAELVSSRAEVRARALAAKAEAQKRAARAAVALRAAQATVLSATRVAELAVAKADKASEARGSAGLWATAGTSLREEVEGQRPLSSKGSSRGLAPSQRAWGGEGDELLEESTDSTAGLTSPTSARAPRCTATQLPTLRGERISRQLLECKAAVFKVGRDPPQDCASKQPGIGGKCGAVPLGTRIDKTAPKETIEPPKHISIFDVVVAATKTHSEIKRRWRPEREVRARLIVAWAFNAFIYVASALLSLTYGVKFKSTTTNEMITVWVLAMLQVYLIIEPLQILIMVCLPSLCTPKTRCGRCCTNAWQVLNEVFRP